MQNLLACKISLGKKIALNENKVVVHLKTYLLTTWSLKLLPLQPGVGQYIAIHAMLTTRGLFLANFYHSGPFTYSFPKPLPSFSCVSCG